jgi:hypothetical protein
LLYSFAKELFNVGLTLYCHGLGIALQWKVQMCVSFKPFRSRAGKTKFQMKYCKDQSLFNKIAKIPKRHFGQTMQGHRVDHWFYLLKKDESSSFF